MWPTTGCCCGGEAQITRLAIDQGSVAVGIVGLKQIFEQLHVMGRKPDAGVGDELLAMVKARNYVPSSAKEQYKTALLREYAAFCASKAPA